MTSRMHLFAPVALLMALALPSAHASAQAKAVRHYDCSKAGNANKTACRGTASSAASAQRATPAIRAVPASAATAARHYDCSKAGNASKAVCRGTASPAAQASRATPATRVVPASPATGLRHYDCSKAGNANKTVCKGAVAAPAPRATTVERMNGPTTAPRNQTTNGAGPQGATAKCRDNTYSHSVTHSGTCSHHGGVAQWY